MPSSDAVVECAPWQADQEWANAWTHGLAAVATVIAGVWMIVKASSFGVGLTTGCVVYLLTVLGTFVFSTMSHVVPPSPRLNRLRAWDQAMIYLMIAGTYTPIIVRFAPSFMEIWLLSAMWSAAALGFVSKVALAHRINSIGTASYVLLGWLPAIPLSPHVPEVVVHGMLGGGVVYSVGVIMLMNDQRIKYLHAGWHLMVMSAAGIHYWMILQHVIG